VSADPNSLAVVVATHGHCFDGLCSAVLFTRLMKHLHPGESFHFTYHSSGYGPGQNGVDPRLLTGDENAIWISASARTERSPGIRSPRERVSERRRSLHVRGARREREAPRADARRMFHDGAYSSCTKLIADIGARTFGLDPEPTRHLSRGPI